MDFGPCSARPRHPPLRGVPAGGLLPVPGGWNRCPAPRQTGPGLRARPLVPLPAPLHSGDQTLLCRREGATSGKGLYEFPLIETPAPADLPDLVGDPRLIGLLGDAPWHLLRGTTLPVHQLSHQRLHARVYRIETPTLTPMAAAMAVRTPTLGDYAVPRLLERYLTSPEAI